MGVLIVGVLISCALHTLIIGKGAPTKEEDHGKGAPAPPYQNPPTPFWSSGCRCHHAVGRAIRSIDR